MSKEKKSPKNIKSIPSKITKKTHSSTVAIGDLHGEYKGFIEILRHTKLIDKSLDWKAKNQILVQMGDVIDRGEFGLEVYDLLEKMQCQSLKFKSKVIRLLGNHELEILKKHYYLTTMNAQEIETIRKKLVCDVLNKKVIAGFYKDGYIFTHAGIRDELIDVLFKGVPKKKLTLRALVKKLNDILYYAVLRSNFSNPIFNISYRRGGSDKFGGIFWEDLRDFISCKHDYNFKQVVAHTPIEEVSVFADGKITAIDVGIFKGYGGGKAYLNLKNKKVNIKKL
ncbi:MAG TPA: metallophosphoesterase [Elusimicrobiales bacterium]|nr:metallophosphoesterase [Elusimicrobiales bacterium]